jgi:glutathione S-transferase
MEGPVQWLGSNRQSPFGDSKDPGFRRHQIRPNMRKDQHKSAAYLKINPKHKVPLLVVDGKVLSESTAIQIWIARTFPQARFLPADPWQELKAISLLSWCSSGIHPFLARINSPPRVCDVPGADESVRRLAASQLFENYKIADDLLADREYFFDHFNASAFRSPLARRFRPGVPAPRAREIWMLSRRCTAQGPRRVLIS